MLTNTTKSVQGNNEEFPKKQAKSYEIDLGQNHGPYKEELLIRYGDNTLHKLMSNNEKRNNMNMEDIMHMNDVLKPFQERAKHHTTNEDSFISKSGLIEANIDSCEKLSTDLKAHEENVNLSIESMTNDIFKHFDSTYNEFNPDLQDKYKYLKKSIKDQKEENANLMKQIDFLNQEITLLSENIVKLGNRIDTVEKTAGLEKSPDDSFDSDYEKYQ